MLSTKGISEFNLETFAANGLISGSKLVKILGRGELKASVKVEAHHFSAKATSAIEAAGGSINKIW